MRRSRLKCVEAPEEEPKVTKVRFDGIPCNISSTTNYMMTGLTEVSSSFAIRSSMLTLFAGTGKRGRED